MAFAASVLPSQSSARACTAVTPRRRPVRATLAQRPPGTASPAMAMPAASAAAAPSATAPPEADPVHQINGEADLLTALERSTNQLVVVRVHARWCRSCRALEPKWRRLARELPQVHFAELEFEANRLLAARLAVEVMPTFLVYDGELGRVDKFSCGPKRAQVLRERIELAMENRRARLAGGTPAQALSGNT